MFLSENGALYVTGSGVYGQLGLPNAMKKIGRPEELKTEGMEKVSQIASGHFHNVALTEDGKIQICIGRN